MEETGDQSDDEKLTEQPVWLAKELLSESEQQAFETLEREFNEVLYELHSDPSLDKFRKEYEKLHRALKKSHESEKRLIKKCRELNTEIITNTVKVKTAVENSEEDQRLILALKEEMQKAWKMVDSSQEKEAKAKENVRALKQEIEHLSGIVDQSVELTLSKDTEVNSLEEEKKLVMRERDSVISTVVDLKGELGKWTDKVMSLEKEKIKFEDELAEIKGELQGKRVECDRELRKKEKLEKDMRELRTSIETSQMQLKQKEATLVHNQEYVAKLETALHEQKGVADRASKLVDTLYIKIAKLQTDLEDQIQSNTQLLAENSSKTLDLKTMEEELDAVRDEIYKSKKLREATMNKLKVTEQQRDDLETRKEQFQNEICQLQKDVETQRKLTESEKKRLEEFGRERDVLMKMKTEAEDSTLKHMDLMKIKESIIHNLGVELQQFRDAAARQDKQIDQLEVERRKTGEEAAVSARKYLKALDDLRDREFHIIELQKKIEETQMQIKQQKAMFEIVRVEKHAYSKRLVETQDEINEAKRKLAISVQMVEHLKEQLSLADTRLEKGLYDITRVEKEKEIMNGQLTILQDKIRGNEDRIAEYSITIDNHDFLMSQLEEEKNRVSKEYDVIKSDRDLLAIQLIRRTDELHLVYEKIRVQQSTLEKGRLQYLERLNELRVLKLKVTDLKREHMILSGSLKSVPILKKEVSNIGRALLKEQLKVRVLSEELETPQNIHRWRLLEASDPDAYDMIRKIQILQRRLITKTEEVVDKDLLLQEKERLYIEMQSIFAHQPGPEVVEQLNVSSRKLLERKRQLKAMSSELHLYQTRVKDKEVEIQSLNEELQKTKQTFLHQKEKELLSRLSGKSRTMALSTRTQRPSTSPSMRTIKSALRVGR